MEDKQNIPELQPVESQQPIVASASRRDWTSYFKEFLMLFLAITLGFFVENKRGQIIEKDIEFTYMQSMLDDLKSDTSQLTQNIKIRYNRIQMIDSMILLLALTDYSKNLNDIYYFGRNTSISNDFFPNDGTIVQLKSSGGLRLIKNSIVSKSIMSYDQKMRLFVFQLIAEQQTRDQYRDAAGMIFDGNVFNSMLVDADNIKRPTNNPPLFNKDRQSLNVFKITAQYLKKLNLNQIKRAIVLKQEAIGVINNIQKAYHLTN